MVDIITYLAYGVGLGIFFILLWVIISNLMAQTHRERMDNTELSLDRMEVVHDMNMGDKYFEFMQERAISEDMKQSRETSFLHNTMLINQDFEHNMENKWFNLYRMQVMNQIQNDNKMTDAFVRAMQIFGISIIANLINAGLSQADVLSLINQGATVNNLKELIQLAEDNSGGNTDLVKFALESLKEANKPFTVNDLIDAVKALKQAGVSVEGTQAQAK
jgi:hypothetical protein